METFLLMLQRLFETVQNIQVPDNRCNPLSLFENDMGNRLRCEFKAKHSALVPIVVILHPKRPHRNMEFQTGGCFFIQTEIDPFRVTEPKLEFNARDLVALTHVVDPVLSRDPSYWSQNAQLARAVQRGKTIHSRIALKRTRLEIGIRFANAGLGNLHN